MSELPRSKECMPSVSATSDPWSAPQLRNEGAACAGGWSSIKYRAVMKLFHKPKLYSHGSLPACVHFPIGDS